MDVTPAPQRGVPCVSSGCTHAEAGSASPPVITHPPSLARESVHTEEHMTDKRHSPQEDWVFTGIQRWNLKIKAHFSCELGLEGFWDVTLVSQINEGAEAMASLGHVRWCLLCGSSQWTRRKGKRSGQLCLAVALAVVCAPIVSSFRIRLSHSQHLSCP